MTVLDTFYLLFKTDISSGASPEVRTLDKQIDDLTAKGAKRSEQEQKQLKELRKRRQEGLQDLKDTRAETDKLGDSFQRMVQGAVGAAAAYTSFGFLKAGLIDANKLNVSLLNLQKTTNQNVRDVKAYGAALAQAGGNPEDLYAFVNAQANLAAQSRIPFNFKRLLKNLHEQVKNNPQFLTYLQQVPGAVPLIPLLKSSDEEFDAKIKSGYESAKLSDADTQAALKNQEAYAKTRQEFDKLATEIDTKLLGTIERLNDALQGLADTFDGHPNLAIGAGIGATAVSLYGGSKLLKWAGNLVGLGGGAASAGEGAAAAAGGVSALSLGGVFSAGLAATWGAGAAGEWLGRKLSGPSSSTLQNKQQIQDFWQQQGYSPGAAAGWTANAQQESSFNPLAVNGSHVGIYQWSAQRRAKILAATGIDVSKASLNDQLKAAAWEASVMGLTPDRIPGDPRQAAALISNRYEVPSLTAPGLSFEAARRGDIAAGYGILPSPTAASGKTVNVKIDDVTIQTQATDAKGIAGDMSAELKNQIRLAISNFDDGVDY
jgi:hypothetical protein